MAISWQLETRDLTKDFGGLRAVNRLSFGIGHQEILGLIGPNGSGKTTCINLIAGVYKPSYGQVFYKGQSIGGSAPWRIAKTGILRTFQHTQLFPLHSVLENMVFACHVHEKTGIAESVFRRGMVSSEKKGSETKAKEILEFVGLAEHTLRPAASLPPGGQRMLAVAVCLAANPELLLLDEPAAGLNIEESQRLINFIKVLKGRGLSIMVVDHHMAVIMPLCDRIIVLDHGTKIAEGNPKEIQANEQVIEAYLGHAKIS